jgi:hypothetical protein
MEIDWTLLIADQDKKLYKNSQAITTTDLIVVVDVNARPHFELFGHVIPLADSEELRLMSVHSSLEFQE